LTALHDLCSLFYWLLIDWLLILCQELAYQTMFLFWLLKLYLELAYLSKERFALPSSIIAFFGRNSLI